MAGNVLFLDKRVKRTKRLLHNSLLKLMEEKRFEDISITNIVEEAEVNRGTFYNHYQYKEDILNEIIKGVINDLVNDYRSSYIHTNRFMIRDLSISSIKIFEHVDRHRQFYKLVTKEHALRGFEYILTDQVRTLMLNDCTMVDPNPQLDIEMNAQFYASGIVGLILEWVRSDFKHSHSYMAEQLMVIMQEVSNKLYRTNRNIL